MPNRKPAAAESPADTPAPLATRRTAAVWRSFFDTVTVGVLFHDADGRVTDVNPAAERIYGLRAGEMLGRPGAELPAAARTSSGTRIRAADHPVARAVTTGDAVTGTVMEFTHPRTGDVRCVQLDAVPLRLRRGRRAPQVFAIVQDLTSQSRAREQLRRQGERFRVVVAHPALSSAICDTALRYTWVHNAPAEFPAERVVGRRDDELFPPEYARPLIEFKRRILEHGRADRATFRMPVAGEVIHLDLLGLPLFDDRANVCGVALTGVDATERVLALRAASDAADRHRLALDAARLGTWELDVDARLLCLDSRAVEICCPGRPPELRGRAALDLFPAEDRRRVLREILELVSADQADAGLHDEKRVVAPDGEIRWTCWTARLHPPLEGEAPRRRLIGTVEDITKRKRNEFELIHARWAAEAANLAKRQFLAVASHELRTPLTAIMGLTELLSLGTEGPVTRAQAEHLHSIESSATHLRTVVDQVLMMAAIETAEDARLVEPVELGALVGETAALMRPAADRKNLGLFVRMPATAVRVETDAQKCRHILLNLISNAIKFTNAGEVEIRLEPLRGPTAKITVRDTGIGIEPGLLDTIFEPFTQADSSVTRRFPGTGMGLSLARHFAELIGGRLRVASEPGRGSTFSLSVPQRYQPG